jgi:hypothetical protein
VKLGELKVTQQGLRRARSQTMRNTLALVEREFRRKGLPPEMFWFTASVMIAKEISGNALEVSEPGFLGRLAEGESGKFMERIVEEILMEHWPDDGPVVDYDVNAPDGSRIEVRNPKPN